MVTELSRWGRSTQDLLETLYKLAGWKVSVVAMSGMTFELDTPHGRMMATMLAGIAQFESDLLSERVKSGLAGAKARGKKLGRQPGQRPKSGRLGVPPKLIIFSGFLVGAGAQHCQGQIRQRDRFATTMTIPTRNGDFGATRAGSK